MRVLFVVPYAPSLVRVRPYNLIRHLSSRGHAVTVATLWTNERERDSLEQLRRQGCRVLAAYLPRWRSLWNCLKALPSSTPLQAVYCWQPALARQVVDSAEEFDVMHVEHLRGAHYGLALRSRLARGSGPLPVVWDSVDCITRLFRQAASNSHNFFSRLLTRFELGRTEKYEGWLAKQFDRVLVTSPAEQTALLSLIPAEQSAPCLGVLTNGVDLDYFTPGAPSEREPATIVLSGKMSYHANVAMVAHFVNNILPFIWRRRPAARLNIVGQAPPHSIQNLARDPRISVVGTVNDLRPYLQRATVAVASLTYGAGIQNKVLEAMACATPVVASPPAVLSLAAQPGVDLLVAREPADFADEVVNLLDSPALQRQVGAAGRQYVEQHHRWNSVAVQLESYYDELVGAKRQQSRS
jgi:sugar transferase (PEP-CTERM/EpsH1 system associated)